MNVGQNKISVFSLKPTSKRRYIWAIILVCSFIALVMSVSWVSEGRVGVHVQIFGVTHEAEILQIESPDLFWSTCAIVFSVSAIGAVIAGLGLKKVQNDEVEELGR